MSQTATPSSLASEHEAKLNYLKRERDGLVRVLSAHEVADQDPETQRKFTAVEQELAAVQFIDHLYKGDHEAGKAAMERISRAFLRMPYGGGRLTGPSSANGLVYTLEQIAYNVECMAESLSMHADSDATEQEELAKYRRLANAGRDLFAMLIADDAS